MKNEFKSTSLYISEQVMHQGKKKTVVGIIVGHVLLTDVLWSDIVANQKAGKEPNFEYGPWIDLDEVQLI